MSKKLDCEQDMRKIYTFYAVTLCGMNYCVSKDVIPNDVFELYEYLGDTSTMQHNTLLTAILGDRKLRPQVANTISSSLSKFSDMHRYFSELSTYLKDLDNVGMISWCNDNLSINSPLILQYENLDDFIRNFFDTMLNADMDQIVEKINQFFDENDGIENLLENFKQPFNLEDTNNSVVDIINNLPESQKYISIHLFNKMTSSIDSFKSKILDAESNLELLIEEPVNLLYDDIATRIEVLEGKVSLLSNFLSTKRRGK